MKKVLQATATSIVLVVGLQAQAQANKLYDFPSPPSNIENTGTNTVEIGFTFSLPPGATPPFSATFNKIGFWVNAAASPTNPNATISLYDITTSGLAGRTPTINQLVGGFGGLPCTMEGQFCYASIPQQTLVSGRTYLLSSIISVFNSNDNTYYADSLTPPSEVVFLNNIVYGSTWFGGNTLSPSYNHGAFGPNLGGVVITGGPTPVPTPLPLLGASAALVFSRRIKARIKISAS